MDSEREALTRFLAGISALATLERKCRRVETIAVALYSGGLVAGVVLPCEIAGQLRDLALYALACMSALSLRRWVLAGIVRRRAWARMQALAVHARARLADLDKRPRPPERGHGRGAGALVP